MNRFDMGSLFIVNYQEAVDRLEKGMSFDEGKHKRDHKGRFSTHGGGKGGQKDSGNDSQGDAGGGQDGQGNQESVQAVRSLSKKAIETNSYTMHNIKGEGASKAYHAAIVEAKRDNPAGAFVHAYEPDEYAEQNLFLSDGGEAGMSITKDGDIVSVFRSPRATKKGVAGDLLRVALANGGKRLDCFDGFLPKLYARYGFVPVAKMKFDKEFAPEDWNHEKDGAPDVLFFAHNGDSREKMAVTEYPAPDLENTPYITDYDDGERLQQEYENGIGDSLSKSLTMARDLMRW